MMKKIIALALALSMALSMVAFAGYTDAAQVNEDLTGDVELVGALGIMTGNPDGSFNPLGTLTRGEAAVVIYRLKANRSDIDASWGDKSLSTFTDMDHWSAPYVNYCAALGLIAGYPDGTFRPEAPVTAVEMAKMLLNVAGYDTEKQGYGKNWPAAVLADATNSGLFADFEAAYTGAASREWVAKLVANLLDVQTVGYSQLTGTLVGNVNDNGAVKFGAQYGYTLKSGTVVATAKEALGSESVAGTGKTVVKVGENNYTLKTALAADMIGSKVNVYFKEAPSTTAENKVYAVVEANKKVVETTIDQIVIDEDADDETKYVLTVGGEVVFNDTKSELTMTQYKNLVSGSYYTFGDEALKDARPVTVIVNGNSDATSVDFYFNDIQYAKKVTKHTADDFAFTVSGFAGNADTEAEYEKLNFLTAVAKNNYVSIEKVGNKDVTWNIAKMSALRSKVSSVVGGKKVVVGGTTYEPAYGYKSTFESTIGALDGEDLKNNTYDLYTDGKYVVSFSQYQATTTTSGVASNVLYLIDNYKAGATSAFTSDTSKVQVLLANGDIAIYEYFVPEVVTTSVAMGATGEMTKTVYEYVMNDDGTIYFVREAKDSTNTGAYFSTSNNTVTLDSKALAKSYMTISSAPVYLSEDTFFFVVLNKGSEYTYSVIKASELMGKDLSGYTFGNVSAYSKNSTTNINTLVYGVMSKTFTGDNEVVLPGAAAADGEYFITTDDAAGTVTADGTTYTVKGINANGVAETLTIWNDVSKNKVYKIRTVGEKVYLDGGISLSENHADALPESLTAGWHELLITGVIDGAVMLTETKTPDTVAADAVITGKSFLTDLADDVTVTYFYKSSTGKVTLKTEDLPESIKFTSLKDGYYKTFTVGEDEAYTAGDYLVYKTTGKGNECVKLDGTWKRRADDTKAWALDNLMDTTINDSTEKEVVKSDANVYSYVCLNTAGEVSEIIIMVEGKDSNTQVDVDTLLTFAQAQ